LTDDFISEQSMSDASEAITKLGIPTPQALVSHRQALALITYVISSKKLARS